jgi:hypothetical protein
VMPGFVFWSLMMPGFPWCLGATAPKLLRCPTDIPPAVAAFGKPLIPFCPTLGSTAPTPLTDSRS